MSREDARLVRLPGKDPAVRTLMRGLAAAERRAAKALPGDRSEVVRYEAMCASLEGLAARALIGGAASVPVSVLSAPLAPYIERGHEAGEVDGSGVASEWCFSGDICVLLVDPFTAGTGDQAIPSSEESLAPAEAWFAGRDVEPYGAVRKRFESQLDLALLGNDQTAAIRPSGVSNRVLTDVLRQYVGAHGEPVKVPVLYKDGSRARPFPLRVLALAEHQPVGHREYRFAMISIRHTEMDMEVDGAWLRNTTISRPRPAAETDEIAYVRTADQLLTLCASEPIVIYLYQTGLDSALIGVYRAITEFLLEHPGMLTVVPMYFRKAPDGGASNRVAGYTQQSTFTAGQPWTI